MGKEVWAWCRWVRGIVGGGVTRNVAAEVWSQGWSTGASEGSGMVSWLGSTCLLFKPEGITGI